MYALGTSCTEWIGLTALWTLFLQGAAAGSKLYASLLDPSSVSGGTSAGPVRPMERLNLWIDGKETERFVGMPMEIFVIREGQVVHFLQEPYVAQHLPVLPPEVHVVKLTWQAVDDIYEYRFSDLRSLDPKTLYNPLISIPAAGIVPRERTDFQVTIPCTRQQTATASMYISLDIWNSRRQPIPGSPIKLHVRKRCIAYDERKICRFDCQNGGRCSAAGQCECRPGYLGQQCQFVACLPECQNNGTCVSPLKCLCMRGYIGEHCEIPVCRHLCLNGGTCIHPDRCECTSHFYGNHCQHKTAICRQSCGIHGKCVDPNQCKCIRGWRGRFCHKTVNRMSGDRSKRRKKRRKTDHGLWQARRKEQRRQLRKRDRRRWKEAKKV